MKFEDLELVLNTTSLGEERCKTALSILETLPMNAFDGHRLGISITPIQLELNESGLSTLDDFYLGPKRNSGIVIWYEGFEKLETPKNPSERYELRLHNDGAELSYWKGPEAEDVLWCFKFGTGQDYQ